MGVPIVRCGMGVLIVRVGVLVGPTGQRRNYSQLTAEAYAQSFVRLSIAQSRRVQEGRVNRGPVGKPF